MSDDAMAGPPAHVSDLPMWQRLGLGVLAEHVPTEVIDDVLAQTGRVQERIRRLPARVSVLFILGLSLFSGMGYRGVWRELTHSGGIAAGPVPSSSGLTRARRRIGVAPLRELFARVRGPRAGQATAGAFLAGLRLVSWDGTQFDVAGSDANDAVFVPARSRKAVAAFGKVRLMTLIEVGTHAVVDAVFGTESEQVLAARLAPALTAGMLLLGDRNLCATRRSVASPAQPGGIGGVFLDLMAYPGSKDSRGREHASKPVIVSRRMERCAGGSA